MLLSCLFAIPFCEYTASNGQQISLVLKFKKKMKVIWQKKGYHLKAYTLSLRGLLDNSPDCAENIHQYNDPLRNARSKTPFAPAT